MNRHTSAPRSSFRRPCWRVVFLTAALAAPWLHFGDGHPRLEAVSNPGPAAVVAGVFASDEAPAAPPAPPQTGGQPAAAAPAERARRWPLTERAAPSDVSHPRWPGAAVLAQAESSADDAGRARRVTLVQPAGAHFAVRVEEMLPPGGGGPLLMAEEAADRVVVQLLPGATAAQLGALAATVGAEVEQPLNRRGLFRLKLRAPAPDTAPEAAAALARLGAEQGLVRFAQTDPVVRPALAPNDPLYLDGSQWNLNKISAPAGWDLRTDAAPVVVAVIDSGIMLSHSELAPNLWTNPGESGLDGAGRNKATNGIDDDDNGYVDDVHGIDAAADNGDPDDSDGGGHGTIVSGVLAARGNNAAGLAGVAWTARLMALRFIVGTPGSGLESDAIECLDYAVAMGAAVSNNSWGGTGHTQALVEAIEAARDADHLLVAASGNDGHDTSQHDDSPGGLFVENILTVAATNSTDGLWPQSNYSFGLVQMAAPGANVMSISNLGEGVYFTTSGTSLAAPHVAAAAALLRSQFPAENYAQILNRLLRGVDALPAQAAKLQTAGRLNLHKALALGLTTPPNDEPAGAPAWPAALPKIRASNRGATAAPGEPAPATPASGASIWLKWTSGAAPAPVAFSTEGSGFDTVLAIFSGADPETFVEVAGNDDAGDGATFSDAAFQPAANTTYHIRVAGKAADGEAAQGLVVLQTKSLLGITSQPLSIGAPPGGSATFAVGAQGVPAPSYRWQVSTDGGGSWNDLEPGPQAANVTAAQLQLAALPAEWNGRRFRCRVSNSFGAQTSAARTLTVADFGVAVGAPELAFTTGGVTPWFPTPGLFRTGPLALRTGRVENLEETWLETTVLGPGNLSFYWKVSSETDFDYLRFIVNGEELAKIAGEVNWTPVTRTLAPGANTIRWHYPKDPFVFEGQDAGWIDDVVWTPNTTMPAYAAWTAALGLDGPDAAPAAEPFRDGLPNLARYAMNLGAAPLPGHLPAASLAPADGGGGELRLRFRRGKNLAGVELRVESSADLETWAPVPPAQITALADDDAQTQRLEAAAPVPPGGRIFLRLVAEETPPPAD